MLKRWTRNYEFSLGRMTPAVKLLLTFTIAAYLLQLSLNPLWVQTELALSMRGLREHKFWQLVSYMFLHGGKYHIHIAINMLLLFMMGPETERGMGRSQFYIMYFLSGILGGVGWLIISAGGTPAATCVGASGAIFGIIGAFAALFPHRYITLLLFFVIPITMKAWVMAVLLGSLELVFLIFHPDLFGGVANAAHLGGGLAGFVYARTVFGKGGIGNISEEENSAEPNGEDEGAAIDRIHAKIDREGMRSLSKAEHEILHRSSPDAEES